MPYLHIFLYKKHQLLDSAWSCQVVLMIPGLKFFYRVIYFFLIKNVNQAISCLILAYLSTSRSFQFSIESRSSNGWFIVSKNNFAFRKEQFYYPQTAENRSLSLKLFKKRK